MASKLFMSALVDRKKRVDEEKKAAQAQEDELGLPLRPKTQRELDDAKLSSKQQSKKRKEDEERVSLRW